MNDNSGGFLVKKVNIKKLAFAGILTAFAVIGSFVSIPVGVSKCAPVQHFVNILSAVFLGPFWAVGIAFSSSLLRNFMGIGSLLAFPGSMLGALFSGVLYRLMGKLTFAYLGELIGTSIIGALVSYPVAKYIIGNNKSAVFGFVLPFSISCAGGTVLAILIITALKRSGTIDKFICVSRENSL